MARFAQCRKQRGLSQKFVALSLGVAAPSVSAWETGDSNPSQDNLIALAALYGVSTDYLLGISNAAQPELDGEISELLTGAQRLSPQGRMMLASYLGYLLAQEQQARPAPPAAPPATDG